MRTVGLFLTALVGAFGFYGGALASWLFAVHRLTKGAPTSEAVASAEIAAIAALVVGCVILIAVRAWDAARNAGLFIGHIAGLAIGITLGYGRGGGSLVGELISTGEWPWYLGSGHPILTAQVLICSVLALVFLAIQRARRANTRRQSMLSDV